MQFKGWKAIACLCLLACIGGAIAPVDAKADPAKTVEVLDPVGVLSETVQAQDPRLNGLSMKKVWAIFVDSGSTLMPAVAKRLPKYAPKVRVKLIDGSKANPFFILDPEDLPDAVIIGTGVGEATVLYCANYAKQAEKLGIPAVFFFSREIPGFYQDAMDKVNFPGLRAYATSLPDPERPEDPEKLARQLIPQLIEGLTQSVGADRPRICFTGTEEKAKIYFETLSWTGGLPMVVPTEERVAELLNGTSRQPEDAVGVMAPGMRQITVEKVAVLATMAGCTPQQMPLALALAELLCRKKAALDVIKPKAPVLQIALGGSAVEMMGKPDSLGRLARLMLMHLGGLPGPVFEGKPVWTTIFEQGTTDGDSTVALFDDHGEIWRQSTTGVDNWR